MTEAEIKRRHRISERKYVKRNLKAVRKRCRDWKRKHSKQINKKNRAKHRLFKKLLKRYKQEGEK